MLRIALSGAQGTGKSTIAGKLIRAYNEQGIKTIFIDDPVRKYSNICERFYQDVSKDIINLFDLEYFIISNQYLMEKIRESSKYDLVLYDGCVLDHFVYWNLLFKFRNIESGFEVEKKLIYDLFRFQIKSFNAIFYLQVSRDLWSNRAIYDEKRSTDPTYYRMVVSMFKKIISDEQIDTINIDNNNNIEETYNVIKNNIDKFLSL
jgi:thymidylate kinase